MILFKQNRILSEMISEYLSIADDTMICFESAIKRFFSNGIDAEFSVKVSETTKFEEKADEKLHKLEGFLFKKSLLPESREDILVLFECVDDIVDGGYHILRYINTRNIVIPPFVATGLEEMLKISLLAYQKTREAVLDIFGKREHIKRLVSDINDYESISDEIQYRLIKELFDSTEIDRFDKILISELITAFAGLTDSCEDAADALTLINLKRVV